MRGKGMGVDEREREGVGEEGRKREELREGEGGG